MKIFKLLGAGIISLTLLGCNSMPVQGSLSDSRVLLQSPELQNWMSLDFVNDVRRADGLIEFEMRFKNNSQYAQGPVDYRIDWFNQNGFLEKTLLSSWQQMEFSQNGIYSVRGISPSPKVSGYQIRIKLPSSTPTNDTTY